MAASTEEQIRRLDLVLAELEQCPRTQDCNLVHEHVYGAKVALLGAMQDEYTLNLELARQALDRMDQRDTRSAVEALLNPLTNKAS